MDDFDEMIRWCAIWTQARYLAETAIAQQKESERNLDQWLSRQMGFLGGVSRPGVDLMDVKVEGDSVIFTFWRRGTPPDFTGQRWTESIDRISDDARAIVEGGNDVSGN